MKREVFVAGSLRIETGRDWNGRFYICADSRCSLLCRSRKEVLQFAKWPTKTASGDSLRSWLSSLEAADAERECARRDPQPDSPLTDELLATGFGPECHELDESDPNHQTRTII